MKKEKKEPRKIVYVCLDCGKKDTYIKKDLGALSSKCSTCKSNNLMAEL
jgi:DNA-directed RNA polymerase subunit RPC12/RpoP